MEDLISFKNVSFRYESDEEGKQLPLVLTNVSLDIKKGSFVAILGRNGSGKSTLAKLTNAINVPTSGTVTVKGMDTSDEKNVDAIRCAVGMVFQNPDNQIVATIVEDDVAFGPENLGVEPAEIRRRVDDALRTVNMYDHRLSEPHKLSGGQKQRVAIAGVLAMQTECIVLDEPTAMLDPSGRKDVIATLRRVNREMGITVVIVTHFMDEAVQADRVVVIDGGKIVMDDEPRGIFRQAAKLRAAGLDVPQATQLAGELRKAGIDVKIDVLNEQEAVSEILRAAGNV